MVGRIGKIEKIRRVGVSGFADQVPVEGCLTFAFYRQSGEEGEGDLVFVGAELFGGLVIGGLVMVEIVIEIVGGEAEDDQTFAPVPLVELLKTGAKPLLAQEQF